MGRPKDTTQYTEKTCRDCGVSKPLNQLVKGKKNTMGRRNLCMICEAERQKKSYHANPEKFRARMRRLSKERQRRWRLGREFGLTIAQYDAMLEAQKGGCGICHVPESHPGMRKLAVDHCHATGNVRGLLCNNCNNGLGRFKDEPARLRSAADYLEAHQNTD